MRLCGQGECRLPIALVPQPLPALRAASEAQARTVETLEGAHERDIRRTADLCPFTKSLFQ